MTPEKDKAREIIKKISDAALELAFVRHDLTTDEILIDESADVKARVRAHEDYLEGLKVDTLNCLTGDDTGCLDPEELDESNCELLWLKTRLKEEREAVWRDAKAATPALPHKETKRVASQIVADVCAQLGVRGSAEEREGADSTVMSWLITIYRRFAESYQEALEAAAVKEK